MEKIAIIKPKNFKKGQISCGICDFILTNSLDIISSDVYDCCEQCRIKWVESRKREYKAGWRPSDEDILEEIKKRKALPLRFMV
tara:strand:+ start:17488 stop:17739 length:252 start_codon:yes stop_codon:yes gene_type:complete